MPVIPAEPPLPWDQFLSVAQSGDLLLFTGTSTLDKVIGALSEGPYSHSAMVYRPPDGGPLLLWESDTIKMASDPIDPDNDYVGAQCGDLHAAVNYTREHGCTPYFRRLNYERPSDFDAKLLEAITTYDGKVAFGTLFDMFKNYAAGHFLGVEGPKNEIYCAELVALTYTHLGLMGTEHPPNFYSPSSFSSYNHENPLLHGSFEHEVVFDVSTIPPTAPPASP